MSETVEVLQISSLIFFNIFCFAGIVAFIVVIRTISKLRSKTEETLNLAQEAVYNIHEATIDTMERGSVVTEIITTALSFVGEFFQGRKKRKPLFNRKR